MILPHPMAGKEERTRVTNIIIWPRADVPEEKQNSLTLKKTHRELWQ